MKKQLELLIKNNPNTIIAEVVEAALEYDDPKLFFENLWQYGCQSWMVRTLIYLDDIHTFYNKHYSAIEDIRYTLQEEWLLTSPIDMDLKNYFAWLSFEYVANTIYNNMQA